MITKEDIRKQIDDIPAIPKFVKLTLEELNKEDITKASVHANMDLAFINYLKNIVNKPIFGFMNEINNPKQIFTILGIPKSIQVIYTYLISLVTPKEWKIFNMDIYKFQKIQLNLMHNWGNILSKVSQSSKENLQIITLIPYTFILIENIFKENSEDVNYLRAEMNIDFNQILINKTGYDIYSLSIELAKVWAQPQHCIEVLKALRDKKHENEDVLMMAKYIHLLLFYELSSIHMVKTGLNSFIEFDVKFVLDIHNSFEEIIENSEDANEE